MTIRHTERRHGTYIYRVLLLHKGHKAIIQPTMQRMALYCADCERTVLETESVGRWRGEYDDGQEQMS